MGSIVKMQQDLGLDPMITTYSQHIGEHEIWPRMLFPRPFETDTWDEKFHVSATGEGWREHTHLIKTPDGDLDYSYRTEDGFGTSCHDYLLKGDEPETKLAALQHFPPGDLYDMSVMKGMVEKVGDEAWWLHHVIGPWDMAAEVRGLVNLSMDIYDRPAVRARPDAGVHRLAQGLLQGARQDRHPLDLDERDLDRRRRRPRALPRVHAALREGVRATPRTRPATWSASTTAAARRCSSRTSPTPGPTRSRRSRRTAPRATSTWPTPRQRIGDRVCLFGGFNEHLLNEGDEATVKEEVARCLDAAMDGGGYVLRSTGQIFFTKPGTDRGHVRHRARARRLPLTRRT